MRSKKLGFVSPGPFREDRHIADAFYCVGADFNYSTFLNPLHTFNQMVKIVSEWFLRTSGVSYDIDKDPDIAEPGFRVLHNIALQARKQYKYPRIIERVNIIDENVQESQIATPVFVLGGVNALISYIRGSFSALKNKPIELYNLTGQQDKTQSMQIEGWECIVRTPREESFILMEEFYVQNPY